MIINRYLLRQVAGTTLTVTGFLVLIMLGAQLVKYFGAAAQGRFDISTILQIVSYRIPDFLILILPLGFYTGLMLVFGRLYVDQEMAVLNASGVSRDSLALKLWPLVLFLMLAEAGLTVYAAPWGIHNFVKVKVEGSKQMNLKLVTPGRFISFGSYTIYASGQSPDRLTLFDVFAHQNEPDGSERTIMAKEAIGLVDPTHTNIIIEFHDGRLYKMKVGQPRYFVSQFATLRMHLNDAQAAAAATSVSTESMATEMLLLQPNDPHAMSEFGFRLSMPFMILVAVILALPLSQVSPRQGRWLRLFPALLLFIGVVIGMYALRLRIAKGGVSALWYVGLTLFYLFFALLLARKQRLTARFGAKPPRPPHGGMPSLVEGN